MKRRLAFLSGALLLFVGATLFILYLFFGRIVKKGIETGGPLLLGTEVKVGTVTLSPFSGRGRVRALRVANPPGFSDRPAIALEDFRISIDPRSLSTTTVVVDEVVISRPEISHETNELGNNLKVLRGHAEKAVGMSSSGSASGTTKIRIRSLRIENGKLYWKPRLAEKTMVLSLPTIELQNVGGVSSGASPAEIVDEILGRVVAESGHAVGQAAKGVASEVGRAAQGVAGKLKGLFRSSPR